MSRLGRFVRLTSDVLNIKGFENEIKNFIEDSVYDTLLKLKPRILDKARKLVKSELEASPEVKSLLGGTLRGDFGFYKGREHDFIDPVINKIVDNIEINIIRQNFIPGKVLISFKVVLFDGDYDQLLTLPLSQYTSEGNVESEIEWLRWLLLEGDKVIIRGYNIDRNVSGDRIAFSRSEQALMAKVMGGAWKVPSQFSGTETNNFITRSIDNIEPEILKTLEYLL